MTPDGVDNTVRLPPATAAVRVNSDPASRLPLGLMLMSVVDRGAICRQQPAVEYEA
jgi:hypothetical protein